MHPPQQNLLVCLCSPTTNLDHLRNMVAPTALHSSLGGGEESVPPADREALPFFHPSFAGFIKFPQLAE